MLMLLLSCSGEPEVHEVHEPHGRDLRDQASRAFAPVGDGAFDRWLGGDDAALTENQKVGLKTFLTEGCGHCHAGPTLGNDDPSIPSIRGHGGEFPEHAGSDPALLDFLSTL